MKRILVTGGAGFIGLHLLNRLARSGDEITVLDNLHPQVHGPNALPPSLPSGVRFMYGDVRDINAISKVVEASRPDLVVHLAAETGTGQSWDEVARYCEVNVTGTAHLIQALRRLPAGAGSRRLVLASSRAVYGEGAHRAPDGTVVVPPPRPPADMRAGRFTSMRDGVALEPLATREDTAPAPASIYASTKQSLAGTDIEAVILRFQNVYGPGQSLRNPYTGVLSIFSEQIMRGQTINIYEDGEIVRDFVYVEDVAEAIVAGLDRPNVSGLVFNVGSGIGTTILEVARQLLHLFDAQSDRIRVSSDFRAGDVRHAVADVSLARATLGWSPGTPMAEGLSRLVSSIKRSSAI
jgi:dTDP-L-rhamnose 4-epimerase